ncbi:MBL fold metallo-hydrolase [Pelagibius sp. Alg239-R121]|uniref:MBL fold metallo-hydrolase n=1 Tax=Pelagibius sp. Alg239-R121 TaxID=2993448 RepID=UPI0024A742EB|nr:MBL fold metallo-hydrolase [Pelagibius sp. Alg239-R121]
MRLKDIAVMLVACTVAVPAWAGDFKVHRYVAEKWNTNSYWLESDSGIVVIDAQLFRSDAKLMATMIKSTGKPVAGAFITHAHGDHFGGLNALFEELGSFPVITTQKTADGFKPTHESYLTYGFGDDFDKKLVEADRIVEDGAKLNLAGIDLMVDEIGAGESENSILIYQPDRKILFTGDATMHSAHFYLGEGFSEGALAQHRHIQKTYGDAKLLYPGHGDPATPRSVLASEIEYITFQQSLVKEALNMPGNMKEDGTGLKDDAVKKIVAAILARYPHLGDYDIGAETFLGWNVSGLVRELKTAD